LFLFWISCAIVAYKLRFVNFIINEHDDDDDDDAVYFIEPINVWQQFQRI